MKVREVWKQSYASTRLKIHPPESPEHKGTWREFVPHLLSALLIIIPLMIITDYMERHHFFVGFETAQLDTLLRAHSRKMSHEIVLVEISKDDYHDPNMFHGRSPLDALTVIDLVAAVKKYHPSVIGVDLETTDWKQVCDPSEKTPPYAYDAGRCKKLKTKLNDLLEETKRLPPSTKQAPEIVWAVVPTTTDVPLELSPVLGGIPLAANLPPVAQGIPQFPMDGDGAVRWYESRVEVVRQGDSCPGYLEAQPSEGKCYMPTFARAIVDKYPHPPRSDAASNKDPDEHKIFNFYGDRYRFPRIDALNFLAKAENPEIESKRAELLEGRIVLIGGAFREARDEYFTPLGPMQGVELNALAIQSDLSAGGIHELQWVVGTGIDFAAACLIVWLFFHFENPRTALLSSLGIVLGAMIGSAVLLQTSAYWFNIVPLAVGVVFHQLYDLAKASAKLHKKLLALRGEEREAELRVTTSEHVTLAERGVRPPDETPKVKVEKDTKVKGAAGGAH